MADDDTTSHPRNPPRPVTLAKGPPRGVTLAKGPQRPVTVSKAPLGKITLSTRPLRPVTLAKNPPGEVSKAKGPERPVTLSKSPPREVTTAKGSERPVTLSKSPERPVTLPSKPPREVTLAKGPTRDVTLAKQPQREITLAKAPPREVTLAKGPERPVTLAKGPERPVTFAKGPERPVTLAKQPQRPVTLPTQPERPVTLARRDQGPPIKPAAQTQTRPITQVRPRHLPIPHKPTPGHKKVIPKANLAATLPTPNAFCQIEGYQPFPAKWERWLSAVREGILSAQPVAGRNVSIDVHEGEGTVINAPDRRRTPAGCPEITVTFSDISFCVDVCIPRVLPDGSTKFQTYTGINDVPFSTAPFTPPEGFSCGYFNLTAGSTTELIYGEPDCSSEGGLESADAGFVVLKAPDGSWSVVYSSAGEVLFAGTSAPAATSPVVISNDYTACGQEGVLPPPNDGRATFACGFGGTATIVF